MSYQVYKMFLLLYALGNVSVVYVGVVSCASAAHRLKLALLLSHLCSHCMLSLFSDV